MKYKIAIVCTQGSFSKEEIIEIIKTNCSTFMTFQITLETKFEIMMAEIILELMRNECKYGLEVLIHKEFNDQSEICKEIIKEADNYLVVGRHSFRFVVDNCVAILSFNKIPQPLTYLASSQKRPVLFFSSYRESEEIS